MVFRQRFITILRITIQGCIELTLLGCESPAAVRLKAHTDAVQAKTLILCLLFDGIVNYCLTANLKIPASHKIYANVFVKHSDTK